MKKINEKEKELLENGLEKRELKKDNSFFICNLNDKKQKDGKGIMNINDNIIFMGEFKNDEFIKGKLIKKCENELYEIFDGEFSYVTEMISGRLNKDILGRMMPAIGEADDIALKLDEALVLQTRITRAERLGDTAKAAKLQRRLDKIDTIELQARLDEIEAILEKEGASVRDVMIGPIPNKAADTVLGRSVPKFVRAGVQQTVFKTENPKLWLKGIAQSVIERSANPAASVVSRAMLDGSPWSLEYVAKQMYEGEYRSFFESYFKAEGRLKASFDWDSLDGARKYVKYVSEDLQQVTGGHPFLLKVISDGEIVVAGESFSLGRRTAEGNIPSSDFIRILNQGDLADPSIPAFASWDKAPQATVVYPSVGTFRKEKSEGLFSFFMQNYSKFVIVGTKMSLLSVHYGFRKIY
jgi:hypothetical protein